MVQFDKRILNALVDSYENSLLSRGENKVAIHISFPFTKKTMPEYFDESSLKYEDIHACLKELERKGFLTVVWKRGKENHIVQKAVLNVENLSLVYRYLGRTPKSEHVSLHRQLLESWKEEYRTPAVSRFMNYLDERLSEGKPVKEFIEISDPDRTERLLRAIALVEANTTPCYIREFSIRHFADSKVLEAMRGTVGKVLRRFGEERLTGVDDKSILAEYNIYHTPNYVYFKGEGKLSVQKGAGSEPVTSLGDVGGNIRKHYSCINKDETRADDLDLRFFRQGIGLSGEDLEHVLISGTEDTCRVITIENLTTFFQWQEKGSLIIYLGGYHNAVRRRLLQMIYGQMPRAEYLHFGDIDVGGFEIYEDLCSKTGIDFLPYHMGMEELEKYHAFAKPLTEHDRKRLDVLLDRKRSDAGCRYLEVLEYMKDHGIKLEQECIRLE